MRRKDREMDLTFAKYVFDTCEWAVLSMNTPEGFPYGVPLSVVRKENVLYFHCAMEGKKVECLKNDARVFVTAVGKTHRLEKEFTTEFESAMAVGTASEVTEKEEKIEALRLLCLRHTPKNMENFQEAIEKSLSRTAIWRVTLDEMTAKRKKYGKDGKELKFGKTE